MKIGLRIDVDTLRGTRRGVPALLRCLETLGVRASFFFCVGPDNMGRHVWRLLRPDFLKKMRRTHAAGLYGWDILLRGTLGPGPDIAHRAGTVISQTAAMGHEIGLHAWDHWAWQTRIERMTPAAIRHSLERGAERLEQLTGKAPVCSAAPAWKCTPGVLREKSRFAFAYNSDCRGHTIFYPRAGHEIFPQPQIPVTLPTYDEVVGRKRIAPADFNAYLFSRLRPGALNVLTIHAEVEGIACLALFSEFAHSAGVKGIALVPLGELLADTRRIESAAMVAAETPGRQGWLALQEGTRPA